MFKKLALLVAALTLAMPVFAADTAAGASAPAATSDAKPAKKHHKKHKKDAAAKTDASAPK